MPLDSPDQWVADSEESGSVLDRIAADYLEDKVAAVDETVDEFLGRTPRKQQTSGRQKTRRGRVSKEGYRGSGLSFFEIFGFHYTADGWEHSAADAFINLAPSWPKIDDDEVPEYFDAIEAGVFAAELLERRTEQTLEAIDDSDAADSELSELIILGDQAFQTVFKGNLRLVFYMVRRYISHGLDLDDLIQVGALGLLRAVEGFDYRKGFKFSTYAFNWINQTVSRALSDTGRIIRFPVHATDNLIDFERWMVAQSIEELTIPSKARMQKFMADRFSSFSDNILNSAIPVQSLDAPIHSIEHDPEDSILSELIVDDFQEDLEERAHQTHRFRAIESVLWDLPDKARLVLELRFGLYGPENTLDQIGNHLGVTREAVRQIQNKTLKQLKIHIWLQDYL